MLIEISYEQALEKYPDQVAEVEAKLRKGKSKARNDSLDTFQWAISYAERIEAMNGTQFMSMLGQQAAGTYQAPRELTIEEKLEKLHDTVRATLEAKKGRGWWSSAVFPKLPQEIIDNRRKILEEQAAERERVDALSPEERQAEINSLLGELSGTPGFMAFSIPRK